MRYKIRKDYLFHERRKGAGGFGPPRILKLLARKVCFFFNFEGEKVMSPILAHPWKKFFRHP